MKKEESLLIIEEMIATAKGNLGDSSIFYLVWGWLVLLAAAINYYLLEMLEYDKHWIAWPILMTMGGVLSVIIGLKKARNSHAKSYIDKAMQFLWIGFTITLIVVLVGISSLGPQKVYPFIIALYGLGTFVSGGMLRFKPLQIGAVAAWVCAAIAYHVDFSDQLILISVAIIFSYILPGHFLARNYRKNA